jgi:hypothetical protein
MAAGLALAAFLAASPARATEAGGEALGAALLNLGYVPAKAFIAVSGLVIGGVVGLLNGGDTRSAYALWVPAASGTFFLRPSHLDGTQRVEFFGTDYADRPSAAKEDMPGRSVYDALYGVERPVRRMLARPPAPEPPASQ